jgi:tripartite-type tricarboxylate transporter receptor subunit TctC
MNLVRSLAAFLFCVFAAVGAGAQTYPTKPVKLVVPFTAGSATDILARTVGQKLTEMWGQSVIVDNRPGAGGTIGTAIVAKSPPDGYTLLVNSAAHAYRRSTRTCRSTRSRISSTSRRSPASRTCWSWHPRPDTRRSAT